MMPMRVVLGLALALAMTWGGARADTVNIDDLAEGQPTVTVFDTSNPTSPVDVTADRVTILSDSGPDFVHFKLKVNNNGNGLTFYTDLFEDRVGGTLSDRFLVFLDTNAMVNGLDVQLASDPVTLALPAGAINLGLDAVENGQFQLVGSVTQTFIGSSRYDFFVRSDIETVPEPATWALLGVGLVGLFGYAWRRQRSA